MSLQKQFHCQHKGRYGGPKDTGCPVRMTLTLKKTQFFRTHGQHAERLSRYQISSSLQFYVCSSCLPALLLFLLALLRRFNIPLCTVFGINLIQLFYPSCPLHNLARCLPIPAFISSADNIQISTSLLNHHQTFSPHCICLSSSHQERKQAKDLQHIFIDISTDHSVLVDGSNDGIESVSSCGNLIFYLIMIYLCKGFPSNRLELKTFSNSFVDACYQPSIHSYFSLSLHSCVSGGHRTWLSCLKCFGLLLSSHYILKSYQSATSYNNTHRINTDIIQQFFAMYFVFA